MNVHKYFAVIATPEMQNIDLINYIFVKMKFLVNMIGRDNFFAKVWNLGQNIRISDKKSGSTWEHKLINCLNFCGQCFQKKCSNQHQMSQYALKFILSYSDNPPTCNRICFVRADVMAYLGTMWQLYANFFPKFRFECTEINWEHFT